MRVLVIGGTGFIGAPTVRRLVEAGTEVILFHRGGRGPSEIAGDRRRLQDFASQLRAARPDAVLDTILANERGASALMEVFRGFTRRVVALSSGDVYRAAGVLHGTEPGEPDNTMIDEDAPLRTRLHPYPAEIVMRLHEVMPWLETDYDKIPAERVVMNDAELPGTVLRLPMVYGPGDPLHRFHAIVKRVDDGRRVIALSESVAQWRGLRGYVDNIASAIALAVSDDRATGRIYNVAEPDNFSELEWTRRIAAAAGFTGSVVVLRDDRAPAHLKPPGNYRQHWAVASSRIREELGYREHASLEEGLRQTIEWERANPPAQIDPAQFDYDAEDAALAGGMAN
jgi:nucleoside-diphosphate-sugar epimerase